MFKLCLAAETASVVALLYVTKTKVSDDLFQDTDSQLYLISRGSLSPPSGWGFDKPEVQIPTLPPTLRWVVGLHIDRCIRAYNSMDGIAKMSLLVAFSLFSAFVSGM